MSENKAICVNCREEVSYRVKARTVYETVRNLRISYKEKIPYCKKCGSELWVEDIEVANVEAYEKAVDKAMEE